MFRLIYLLLLIVVSESYSQTSERPQFAPKSEKHRNKTDEIGRKQGHWKFYSESRTITWEIDYVDDVKHGLSRRYFSSGKVMREIEYEYGLREGTFKRYYLNGQVRQEGSYSSNKKTGTWTSWYSSGNMQSEGIYINGYKEGEWKYYNQKGMIINAIFFVKGRDQKEIVAAEKKAEAERLKKQKKVKTLNIKPAVKPQSKDSIGL